MRAGTAATQQTLTLPAQQVLHNAINDARGRCHSQVQPLHVASMLLAHPGSPLRRACSASHTESPTQGGLEKCRALELCFDVALERLTANPTVPPIPQPPPVLSNALNAALKRAQAHQRRGCPEQQQPPLLAVKVEIEQLIISILDDPSVSRVMKEAGFSSTQVKSYLEDMVGSQPTSPDKNVNANMAVFNYNMGVGTGGFLVRPMLPDTQVPVLASGFPMLQPGGVLDMSFSPRTHSMLARAPSPILELPPPPIGLPTSRTSPMMVRPPPENVGGQQQRSTCCPQCMAQLEAECNQVREQERALLGQEASQSFSDTSRKGTEGSAAPLPSWLQKEKDMKTEKVKTQSIAQKMQDLQHKWQNTCRTRHGTPVSSPANMTHSSSPLSRMNAGICDTGKPLALMRSSLISPTPKPLANSVTQPSLVPGLPHWARSSPSSSPLASRAALQQAGGAVSSPVSTSSGVAGGIRVSPPVAANSSSKDGSSMASVLEDPEDKSTETSEQEGFGAPFSIDLELGRPKPSPFAKSSMSTKIQDYRQHQCTQDPSEGASPLRRLGQSPLLVNNALGNHLLAAKSPLSMFSSMRTGQTVTPISSNPTFNNNQVLKPPPVFNQRAADGLKHVYKGLMERVSWQPEAIAATYKAVLEARSGQGKCQGVTAKADSWLLFLGPDQVGKRLIANRLSELVFGSQRKPIWFGIPSSSAWGNLDEDMDGIQYWGRTPLDKMVEALKKNPLSVLFLEDIDKADEYVRLQLSKAMETGKLTDSSGRQVSVSNAIIVMTVGVREESITTTQGQQQDELPLSERRLTHLGGVRMRLALESSNNNRKKILFRGGPTIAVVEHVENPQDLNNSGLIRICAKRKGDGSVDSVAPEKRTKVTSPARAIALDLNLLAEENEEAVDGEDNNLNGCLKETTSPVASSAVCKYDERDWESVIQDARKRLTLKFFSLVDEMIIFKPYDFKGQATRVLSRLAQACTSFITSNGVAGVEVEFSLLEHIVASIWKKPGGEHLFELWIKENFEKSLSSLMSDNEMAAVEVGKVLKIHMVDKILLQEPASLGYDLPLQIEVGSSRY